MTYEPIDLERMDETFEDLVGHDEDLPPEQGEGRSDGTRRRATRDERVARTMLYPRARLIDVAPIDPPTAA